MKILIALSSLFMTAGSPAPAIGDYKIVKQDKVVTLYERWIQNGSGEKVRELKANFDVRSSTAKLVALLQNQYLGIKWTPHAKEYKVSATKKSNQWINYVKYSMPWPFDDQDCCLLFSVDNANQVSFSSVFSDNFPLKKNITRINNANGKWVMQDKGNGLLNITYTISTAKSKKVPAWISDPIVRNNMVETMKAFKKTLENE